MRSESFSSPLTKLDSNALCRFFADVAREGGTRIVEAKIGDEGHAPKTVLYLRCDDGKTPEEVIAAYTTLHVSSGKVVTLAAVHDAKVCPV